VRIGGRARSAFTVSGYVGLALSIPLAMALAVARGLEPAVMAAIILAGLATFLTLSMATKIVCGEERQTYYHHEIAVMAVTTLLVWALGRPVVPYLDVTILGIGAFLACVRVGCLMVGCCHGRPHRWGVRYRPEHAAAGFSPHLLRARLFPVQALESLWVAVVVAIGATMILTDQPAGSALAWYVVAYDAGRFCFELLRGDAVRPYFRGFSEAQWISIGLTLLVVGLEVSGVLPASSWHGAVAVGMIVLMTWLAARRRADPMRAAIVHPRHVREVASALDLLGSVGKLPVSNPRVSVIDVAVTSLGVRISAGDVADGSGRVAHFALSEESGMTPVTATIVADLVALLRDETGQRELVERNGVYHLLVHRPT
jgi:hypothetical protein